MEKPIPESYWVIEDSFLAGSYPISRLDVTSARLRLASFLQAGFTAFFDLTREGELPAYLPYLLEEAVRFGISIQYQRITIQDKGLPVHEQVVKLLDAIDGALTEEQRVYLHCWGGIGRTGMAVGCWLVRHGRSGAQALQYLQELYHTSEQSLVFPHAPETDAQACFVLEWEE